MKQIEAKELLRKYRAGIITEQEKAILESWYIHEAKTRTPTFITDAQMEQDLGKISRGLSLVEDGKAAHRKGRRFLRFSIAASIVVALSASAYLFYRNLSPDQQTISQTENDVPPGTSKAVLTLADNTQVILDESTASDVAKQTGISVRKLENGRLKYIINDQASDGGAEFNTISTPRGGEYQVELSDGSIVWLNSNSSVRFPLSFAGAKRRVEVTGEVYLEVAKNAKKPFLVESRGQIIEVLGTHFNVNAYDDSPVVKTTLLEGSVKVSMKNARVGKVLKPGEQSITGASGQIELREVDLDEAVDWKNGYFFFNDQDLESIMAELGRWYNVEVQYENDGLKSQRFGGTISRSKSLAHVLKVLELTGNIRYRVEGRRIIVMA